MNGILLAGGRSLRMGKDKRSLDIAGVPMLTRCVRIMKEFCEKIWVVVDDKAKFDTLASREGVHVVQDVVPQRAALVGIYTGLMHSDSARSFVQPCDMPFIPPAMVLYLASLAKEEDDWILPRYGSRLQPLCSIYSKSCIPVMEEAIRARRWRLADLKDKLKTRIIPYEELRPYDATGCAFTNVNTQSDYLRVLALITITSKSMFGHSKKQRQVPVVARFIGLAP